MGVVGLGLMGHGIAQTAAEKGYHVTAVEIEDQFLASGLARVEDSVKKCAACLIPALASSFNVSHLQPPVCVVQIDQQGGFQGQDG